MMKYRFCLVTLVSLFLGLLVGIAAHFLPRCQTLIENAPFRFSQPRFSLSGQFAAAILQPTKIPPRIPFRTGVTNQPLIAIWNCSTGEVRYYPQRVADTEFIHQWGFSQDESLHVVRCLYELGDPQTGIEMMPSYTWCRLNLQTGVEKVLQTWKLNSKPHFPPDRFILSSTCESLVQVSSQNGLTKLDVYDAISGKTFSKEESRETWSVQGIFPLPSVNQFLLMMFTVDRGPRRGDPPPPPQFRDVTIQVMDADRLRLQTIGNREKMRLGPWQPTPDGQHLLCTSEDGLRSQLLDLNQWQLDILDWRQLYSQPLVRGETRVSLASFWPTTFGQCFLLSHSQLGRPFDGLIIDLPTRQSRIIPLAKSCDNLQAIAWLTNSSEVLVHRLFHQPPRWTSAIWHWARRILGLQASTGTSDLALVDTNTGRSVTWHNISRDVDDIQVAGSQRSNQLMIVKNQPNSATVELWHSPNWFNRNRNLVIGSIGGVVSWCLLWWKIGRSPTRIVVGGS